MRTIRPRPPCPPRRRPSRSTERCRGGPPSAGSCTVRPRRRATGWSSPTARAETARRSCSWPLGIAFAEAGLSVLRCDLPYRQERPKGPPFPSGAARDREGLRQAVTELRGMLPGRVYLGGQSYGGRQASLLVAEEPGLADGLLLLSYPLHPPGRAKELRTAHFPALRVPTVFAHGSQDPFGSLEELETARASIPGPTTLVAIDGAGHGLGRGTRAPEPAPETIARIVDAFLSLVTTEVARHRP